MKRSDCILCFLALCSLASVSLEAGPITYIVQTTASGTLGGVPFTDAGFTVALTGDTTGVVPIVGGFSLANPGAATLVISGLGAAAFTDSMAAVSTFNTLFQGIYAVGIGDATQGTLISFAEGPQLQGYDLTTALSFSSDGGLGNGGGAQNTFPTTAGDLVFVRQQPPPDVPASISAVLTTSLTGQGGTMSTPVSLTETTPVGQVSGTISAGDQEYYSFYWSGGVFAATASLTNAVAGTSFAFSGGAAGPCNSIGSQTLNSGDNFSGIISSGNLDAGQYCIGLTENGIADPNYAITFNTPLSTPEPATFALIAGGIGAMALARRARGRKLRG